MISMTYWHDFNDFVSTNGINDIFSSDGINDFFSSDGKTFMTDVVQCITKSYTIILMIIFNLINDITWNIIFLAQA